LLTRNPDELKDDQEPYMAGAAGLPRFLEGEACPATQWPDGAGEPTAHLRPVAQRGARPNRLERLGRHEVHLDRKLERMLNILIQLQNLRRTADPG
jgi:hypothetical protein